MMRKEYNKFLGLTFCVMAIAIYSKYLNIDTVVIIGF